MRFHILAVPHTITNKEYVACAFTQKVLKFCDMMTKRGHTTIHYGHEDSEVNCSEHVTVITRDISNKVYGDYDWRVKNFKFDMNDEAYQTYNRNAIAEIKKRQQPNDFVLAFWGQGNKAVCDALPNMYVVEPGIGYSQAFANYRIYETYALMHSNFGLELVQYSGNMPWYHCVIPNYFDVNDFEFGVQKSDYFLYLGRITKAKGLDLIIDITGNIGAKLVIAGQGEPGDIGLSEWPSHVEYVGYADAEKRKTLMKNAKAVFILSTYVEPFAGTMIESFLSGTPVISTDWGTFAENNLHGLTGYRCRTFPDMVWAARNIHNISPQACRTWGENFTLEKVAPMYEEYFESVIHGWYGGSGKMRHYGKTYPLPSNKTIDAFFPCHTQVFAAEKAIESYRNCYPGGKVIMVNDGGDPDMQEVADKFGAQYTYKENIGICNWKDPAEWFERFFEAVNHFESDFFVMQEEDVFHQRTVDQSKLKYDICGTNPYARLPDGRYYAGSGGCFFRTEFFKKMSNSDWRQHLVGLEPEWLHADIVLSFLTYKYGGSIGYCEECCELGLPEYNKERAVVHQYKNNYDTKLCRLAFKYGADKCPKIFRSYTPEYDKILGKFKVNKMLEIGIGNSQLMNTHIPYFQTKREYIPGASLRMWRDYFPNARVYGCDIDPSVIFEDDRIKTFVADQSSPDSLYELMKNIGSVDFIMDDGSHQLEHQITSFKTLWDYVELGGVYIIEDIPTHNIDAIKGLSSDEVEYVHLTDRDDNFVMFRKKKRILWVSAYREINRESWKVSGRSFDEYLECFHRLVKPLSPNLVLYIDDKSRIEGLDNIYPYDIEDTFIPRMTKRQQEILDDPKFKSIIGEKTWVEYTNADYSMTLSSKECFTRRASDMFPNYTHYAFIDFGYAKTPEVAPPFPLSVSKVVDNKIMISSFRKFGFDSDGEPFISVWGDYDNTSSYNWNNPFLFVKEPIWAIQGNLWVVPKQYTHWLEESFIRSLDRLQELGLVVGHDEPVWLYVIHDFMNRFHINLKTDWQSWDWIG